MSITFERLPSHSKPVNYNLTLTPNLQDYTFTGQQVITVEILEATDNLVLNSAEIEITTAKFNDAFATKLVYNAAEETVRLSFPSPLPVGVGWLTMSFAGQLNDRLKGFYRSTYTDSGVEIRCAVTQFAPTDARRAFPCWDEPELKATFDVTLVVESDLTALSNMPEIGRIQWSTQADRVAVKFDQSPVMSTYLVACIVGRFDYVEDVDTDGVKLRVYTPVGKREQGRFALEVAKKTLPFYREFFGIAYPLPKLDLIAVPDFAFGAMENWGLVAYRQTALLVDAQNSSAATKERVALVVGHELAHQWFGNLVTMKWWTHLWLNEGFASWVEYLCVDHCYPEFDIWTRFVKSDLSRALELDALDNSHPIEIEIGNPCEIDEIFDAISYSKGASIIRMLHEWLGEQSFRNGLSLYLQRHQCANASTEHLWQALAEASGQPVQFVMDAWTKQMGYPVITVSTRPALDDPQNCMELTIRQSKFQLSSTDSAQNCNLTWRVPVQVLTATGYRHQLVLTDKAASFNLPKSEWVKLNPGCIGVYRTEYSQEMLQDLVLALQRGELSQRDRFNLENDLFALASAGRVSTVRVLQLAEAFKAEEFYTVWSDLLCNLSNIRVLADHLGMMKQWCAFIRQLCEPAYQRLGWDNRNGDGHDAALLRSALISSLGQAGHEAVLSEARIRFARHYSGEAVLPADLRASVYTTMLANGGVQEFEAAMRLLDATDLQEEKDRILRSLGSTKNPKLHQRVLELAVSQKVRLQDAIFVIGGAASGSLEARRATWQFVKSRWAWFHEKLSGQVLMSRLVQLLCNHFCSAEDSDDVEAFFKANPVPSAERNVRQALENARLNSAILARDGDEIKQFLAKFQS